MKMRERTYQSRRDFKAIYECESCGHVTKEIWGYDDRNYHENVIPAMRCPDCGEASGVVSSRIIVPEGVVL